MSLTWQELCNRKPQHLSSIRKRTFKAALLGSVLLTALIMGARYFGMLQSLELQAFDQLIRLRPDELPDPRLLIVAVDENDLQLPEQQRRKGSLSDTALNQLLQKLAQYKPRVIGLDIYRDFPVDVGQKDLANRMRQNENIVAVCKAADASVNDSGVAPPPEIPVERLGFSDFIPDPDGVLRRHLLAMDSDPDSLCTTPYAFNVQLAFRYLASMGILPKYTPSGFLQLGNTVFKPLEAHTGAYQQVDTWGHQVLLNYRSPRSPENIATTLTLSQVLKGQIKNPDLIKGRIILIGTTANSYSDYWQTPYIQNQFSAHSLSGVTVQAQMVSQILSAVLDKRPLLWVWSTWGEIIWIFSWSFAGGLLAMRLRSPLSLGLAVVGGYVCLYGVCIALLFQSGCWVPFLPAAIALVVSSLGIAIYAKPLPRS